MNTRNVALLTLVEDFLESSTSGDSDIEENLPLKLNKIPRIENYITDVVHSYSDQQFKGTFRIERTTANYLIDKFAISSIYSTITSHGGSPAISPETHILSFIWFISNKCCLRDVAERFGVGISTCFRQINRVLDFFVQCAPIYIKFPHTLEEKETLANEFAKISGFPNILGCIDGTSIPIRTPAHKIKSTYVNRHDIPAVTLQGICDFKRKFIDVFTGPPGKIHDSRVYQLSFISNEIPVICGKQCHIIGDSAYHLREYLLTPYRDYGALTDAQRTYNYKLSATRVIIENTFGILKSRFRQLSFLDFHQIDKITKCIIACCVVHNLCIDFNDTLDDNEIRQNEMRIDDVEVLEREAILRQLGEVKRETICRLVSD